MAHHEYKIQVIDTVFHTIKIMKFEINFKKSVLQSFGSALDNIFGLETPYDPKF